MQSSIYLNYIIINEYYLGSGDAGTNLSTAVPDCITFFLNFRKSGYAGTKLAPRARFEISVSESMQHFKFTYLILVISRSFLSPEGKCLSTPDGVQLISLDLN